ncbi:MAG: hypothetical protein ACP5QG_05420 [candidate division WOR-3 bacterium]
MRIAIPSKSGADVAYFPLHAPKIIVYSVDDKGNRNGQSVIDLPPDREEKMKAIRDSCEVFLSRDGNRDFLMDIWAEGLGVFIIEDKNPEAAVWSFLNGKARPFASGPCTCGR